MSWQLFDEILKTEEPENLNKTLEPGSYIFPFSVEPPYLPTFLNFLLCKAFPYPFMEIHWDISLRNSQGIGYGRDLSVHHNL